MLTGGRRLLLSKVAANRLRDRVDLAEIAAALKEDRADATVLGYAGMANLARP